MMPEQNEWGNGRQYNPDFGITEHSDSGDYTWPQTKPVDCRTYNERIESRFVDLETAITVLVDEVRHLREDLARMKNGESEL